MYPKDSKIPSSMQKIAEELSGTKEYLEILLKPLKDPASKLENIKYKQQLKIWRTANFNLAFLKSLLFWFKASKP